MLLSVGFMLASCATLSEEECNQGDWRGIGFADGAAGREATFVAKHREACADYGITPDLSRWQAGRAEGLRLYCRPERAYQIGRSGGRVTPVCQPDERAAMLPAYQFGLTYHEIGEDIRDLRRDEAEIRDDLDLLANETSETQAILRRKLLRDLRQVRSRRNRLELRRRRYASWPA